MVPKSEKSFEVRSFRRRQGSSEEAMGRNYRTFQEGSPDCTHRQRLAMKWKQCSRYVCKAPGEKTLPVQPLNASRTSDVSLTSDCNYDMVVQTSYR
jgi:hypothetical protein